MLLSENPFFWIPCVLGASCPYPAPSVSTHRYSADGFRRLLYTGRVPYSVGLGHSPKCIRRSLHLVWLSGVCQFLGHAAKSSNLCGSDVLATAPRYGRPPQRHANLGEFLKSLITLRISGHVRAVCGAAGRTVVAGVCEVGGWWGRLWGAAVFCTPGQGSTQTRK